MSNHETGSRVVTAPGKVLVSGEYAVLDGAPGIVMAVDRRARVRLSDVDGDWHLLSLPGFREEALEFRVDDAGAVSVRDGGRPPMDLALIGQVWNAVGVPSRPSLRLELDTRPFFHDATKVKLGLGSSAALAVALTGALLAQHCVSRELVDAALAAHRAWQGGRGSGADIAASAHGGVLACRADAGGIEPLRWPEGLHWALLWSGRPAATADRVAKFRQSMAAAPARKAAARLANAAEEVLASWRTSDAGAVLASLCAWSAALAALDVDGQLGIFEAGHRELAEAAADGPVLYKPCGAGGGDIGMALALEQEDLDGFVSAAARYGFERLRVATDPRGAEGYSGK